MIVVELVRGVTRVTFDPSGWVTQWIGDRIAVRSLIEVAS